MIRRVPAFSAFATDRLHIPRREELPLLDVDGASGLRGRIDQIGLTREQRGNLDHIDDLRRGAACDGSWMSVSTRTPTSRFTRARISRPSIRPGPRNEL